MRTMIVGTILAGVACSSCAMKGPPAETYQPVQAIEAQDRSVILAALQPPPPPPNSSGGGSWSGGPVVGGDAIVTYGFGAGIRFRYYKPSFAIFKDDKEEEIAHRMAAAIDSACDHTCSARAVGKDVFVLFSGKWEEQSIEVIEIKNGVATKTPYGQTQDAKAHEAVFKRRAVPNP